MYTQCPECAVVLSISAHDLRAAGGEVCCGACSYVFNALHHLVDTDEELIPDNAVQPSDADLNTLSDDPGDQPSTESESDNDDSGAELDEPDPASNVETNPIQSAPEQEPVDEEAIAWSRTIAALGLADEATLDALAEHDKSDQNTPFTLPESSPTPIQPALQKDTPANSPVVFEFVNEVNEPELLGDFDPNELLTEKTHSHWLKRGLWAGIVVATLLLLIQVLHFQRNELAIDASWGPTIQNIYAKLGMPLDPNWDVKQYDIADGGGSADPRLPGILLVRARLSNLGDLRMPLPLIKLNLKDRWGDLVGGRTFTPPEYLTEDSESQFLLPGASVIVQLRIIDPGENANGFSVDACLSTNQGRLRCRYDTLN